MIKLLLLTAVALLPAPTYAFEYKGFRSGMSIGEVFKAVGPTRSMTATPGVEGVIAYSYEGYPLIFEICKEKLIAMIDSLDRDEWVKSTIEQAKDFGSADIEVSPAGQSTTTIIYMTWHQSSEKRTFTVWINDSNHTVLYGRYIRDRTICPEVK